MTNSTLIRCNRFQNEDAGSSDFNTRMMRPTFLILLFFCVFCVAASSASAALFTPNPVTVGVLGNEPLVQTAPDKTIYVSALQHLYRSTNNGATFTKLTYPLFSTVVASDSSISIDPLGRLYLAFDYPYAGTTAACTSDDRGDSWTCNPSILPGGTDRMWVNAPSSSEAYVVTNEGLYETVFFKSSDRGATWIPNQFGAGLLEPQTGPLLKKPGSTNVLQVTKLQDTQLSIYVYNPNATLTPLSAIRPTGLPNPYALPSISIDTSGTIYVATETPTTQGGSQLAVARSADEGVTWQTLPPIPQTANGTATFTWVAAGAPGHIGVIYYYTPDKGDPSTLLTSKWSTYYAETYNAKAANPTWTVQAVETDVHTGAVCISASCAGNARFAGDFISSYIDAGNNSHLVWMRDDKSVRYQRVTALATTAAAAAVSGRVTSNRKRGINRARITLTSTSGEVRTTFTNTAGYYRFNNVRTGSTYVVGATSKNYVFGSPLVVDLSADSDEINFRAEKSGVR